MIKKNTEKILKELIPDFTDDDKMLINIFNEIQYRINTIFEALVCLYSSGIFLQNVDTDDLNIHNMLEPLRLKMFIYNSYLVTELNNLINSREQSSIAKFIEICEEDIKNGGLKFKSIFGNNIELNDLLKHFYKFQKWMKNNALFIKKLRHNRNKNFSHVDHDFNYNDLFTYEELISTVAFLSDYASILTVIMDMASYKVINQIPVAKNEFMFTSLDKTTFAFRFSNEVENLIDTNFNLRNEDKSIFYSICITSINLTLNRVELINLESY